MAKKNNVVIWLMLLSISLFSACDKENINKDLGQYAIAVTYNGTDSLELQFVIDGEVLGSFSPVPNVNPSYVGDCKDLKKPEELINVFVFKKIPIGLHQLEIKDKAGDLFKKLNFEMTDKECVFQEVSFSFN